jgi:LmbE family N-acetylglucosaminyl deacetylase
VKLFAIGAHLDDVEVACGGTIARVTTHGHTAKILVLSDSTYSSYDGTVYRTAEESLEEGAAAAAILGVKDLEVLHFPTKDVPFHSSVVEAVEQRLDGHKPEVILTHWPFDTHQAHHNTGLSTIAAGRYYTTILMYEPMMPAGRSHMAFRPQVYVDISDFIDTKLEALRAHRSQYRKYGDAWIEAVESRCRLRGFEMGTRYAEAFEAVRFEWRP